MGHSIGDYLTIGKAALVSPTLCMHQCNGTELQAQRWCTICSSVGMSVLPIKSKLFNPNYRTSLLIWNRYLWDPFLCLMAIRMFHLTEALLPQTWGTQNTLSLRIHALQTCWWFLFWQIWATPQGPLVLKCSTRMWPYCFLFTLKDLRECN